MRSAVSLVVVVVALSAVLAACGAETAPLPPGDADRGADVFATNCIACHGPDAAGSPNGPPLVHERYAPDVASDEQFADAVRHGVPERHWDFGRMPRVAGLDDQQIADVIAYVRERQAEAGLGG